ncbi:hypothetical protein AYO40_05790 [Planctomycetaceae bacterium SCGC AG-212-D15]|nr:hypothetical protein AYO40_05790 [Planctomycetaceae bacterium SCGC AG-212-D15]
MAPTLQTNGKAARLCVADVAEAKRLPADFLASLGVHDLPGGGVGIPYYDPAGTELFTRERESRRAGAKRFYQPTRVALQPYGMNRLDRAHKAGVLIVPEGESDCWALWHARTPRCRGGPLPVVGVRRVHRTNLHPRGARPGRR